MGAAPTRVYCPRAAMWVMLAMALSCDIPTPPGAPFNPEPPSAPSPITPPPTSGPLQPAPPFPPVGNASAIYVGAEDLYDSYSRLHESRLPTRFVFLSDSTFELQFSSYRYGF